MRQPATSGVKDLKNLQERIQWLMINLIDRNELSNVRLAAKMKVDKKSICNYRGMHTTPDILFVKRLGEKFGVNVAWVHTGEGEPFNEPDSARPPVMIGEGEGETVVGAPPRSVDASPRNPKTADASGADLDGWRESRRREKREMVKRIRESGNIDASALLLNIEMNDPNDLVRESAKQMRRELTRLRNKVTILKMLVKSLKGG